MPRVAAPPPPPTPEVAKAKVHVNDLISSVSRISDAWNKSQLDDAIRSAEFFIGKMKSELN